MSAGKKSLRQRFPSKMKDIQSIRHPVAHYVENAHHHRTGEVGSKGVRSDLGATESRL
jgi:hypothetical protein